MMNRFTEDAQEALQRAQQIMFEKQQQQLDVEHIFLALLVGHHTIPMKILDKLGADPEAMVHQIDKYLSNPQSFGFVKGASTTYITVRASRMLKGAAEEADRLNDGYISTEHLLLAMSAERSGAVARVFQEAGIDREKIYKALGDIRASEPVRQAHADQAQPARLPYEKDIVNPDSLPKPRGFNHGIVTSGGSLLFLAGQTALDKKGKIVAPGDIVGQYRQVLSNLQAVVEEAGGEMENIVKMTIFVSDRDNYKAHLKELGKVHKEFFGSYYPATALLEISRFFDDEAMLEIEGMAVLEKD